MYLELLLASTIRMREKLEITLLLVAWVLCITFALGKSEYYSTITPPVKTSSGEISGEYLTVGDKDVTAFLGIPYAQAPVGELRFMKPRAVKNWEGVYYATAFPPPCTQRIKKDVPWIPTTVSSEDCLYLNVWIPGKWSSSIMESLNKFSVMVWIYGGAFYSGSIDQDVYNGATLASEGNVIIVTVNYRVGSFGFFVSGTEDSPGNMGLLDQNLAMRWVKDNIQNFGGDSMNITLFGESAGGISVGLHMISPMSKDLFEKVILDGGTPNHPQFVLPQVNLIAASDVFARMVGCSDDETNLNNQPKIVVECLRDQDLFKLADAENVLLQNIIIYFTPVYGDEFLPESPIEAIDSGNFKQMPILLGNNKNEGSVLLHILLPKFFRRDTAYNFTAREAEEVIAGLFQNSTNPLPDAIADFYMSGVTENEYEKITNKISDSLGDNFFVCPSMYFAEKMDNVYYYFFTHRPQNSIWGKWMGTTHYEDVAFVFASPLRYPNNYTEEEVQISRDIIQKFSSFARTANPTPDESWPKYTASNPQFEVLDPSNNNFDITPYIEACEFWRPAFVVEN